MKSFIMILALLSSASAFANGVQNCQALLGNYKCTGESETLSLEIQGNASQEAIKIDLGGVAEYFYIDGAPQIANDESIVIAECRDKKEIAVDKVKGKRIPLYSILKTADGVKMIGGDNEVVMNCKK